MSLLLVLLTMVESTHGWVSTSSSTSLSFSSSSRTIAASFPSSFQHHHRRNHHRRHHRHHHHHHRNDESLVVCKNFLDDIGAIMSGGKLEAQDSSSLPYGKPLGRCIDDSVTTLAIQERALSFTGEDFDVYNANGNNNTPYCKVRGAMLHLPGKDKMRISSSAGGVVVASLDRKLISMTPTYDIYRGNDAEKIGWLEKAVVALTDTFVFHAEADQRRAFGPFKPPAAYQLEGDFVDRNFVMKNAKGQVVAKVSKDSWVQFDAFNHYQIQIAPGMDPILVVACACAIDEEFDEEHEKKRKEKEQGQLK
jgi:uncharacterized protein YxjI